MRNPILVLAAKWRGWSRVQRGLVVVLGIGLFIVIAGSQQTKMLAPKSAAVSAYPPVGEQLQYVPRPSPEQSAVIDENELKQLEVAGVASKETVGGNADRSDDRTTTRVSLSDPLIAHTAELAMATKEFSRSRTSLEEILERHRGYAAKLRMVGQKSGSVLSATLRVPSAELTETVSELKSLGDVEREEQAADEITQQRADLEAGKSAAAGFQEAMASVIGFLAFLIARGPVVLLWCVILFVPVRFAWKKWATVAAQPSAVASGH